MSRCIPLLKEYGPPEKVILFGTLAIGQVHEWSDIDLVVIERTRLPFFQRIKKIRKLLKPEVGMDIMVYTPDDQGRPSRHKKESGFKSIRRNQT